MPTPQIIHLYAVPVAFLFYFCGHLLQSQRCTPGMAFVLVLSLVVYTYSTLSTRHDSLKENTFGHENCFRISMTNAFHWLFHRDFYPLPSFSLSLQFSSIFLLVESRNLYDMYENIVLPYSIASHLIYYLLYFNIFISLT